MALKYYFNAEDVDFPYQVTQNNSDGTYVGQIPMSASLGNYTKGSAGASSQIQATPMGGNPVTIKFNDIDWALCLPLPAAYSTDKEICAYLSILFTGQQGTLVPPASTSTNMFASQPIGLIDLADGAQEYYLPLNGYYLDPDGLPYTADTAETVIPLAGSFLSGCLAVSVTQYSASKAPEIELMVNGGLSGEKIDADAVGTLISTGANTSLAINDRICLKMTVYGSGSGTITLGCVSSLYTPA